MKIFCIGKNYADHAAEMNSAVPEKPLVFMKPSTALLKDGKPFYFPDFTKDLHHEIELVLRVSKNGKHIHKDFALDYIDAYGIGIDLTARDIQKYCKDNGYPWEVAKSFDNSAILGQLHPFKIELFEHTNFHLNVNGVMKQKGVPSEMIFDPTQLIVYISSIFTLQKGDLIYTGTPAGVGALSIGDRLEGYLNSTLDLYCEIK